MSPERVELAVEGDRAYATLFLGDREITGCTVVAVEGNFHSGTEGVVIALLGLVRQIMATKPPGVEIRLPNIIRVEDLSKGGLKG